VTQWILGVRTDYDGLLIDPCIPATWKGFKVTRIFRGEKFEIEVRNPKGVMKGVRRIVMDGVELADRLLRPRDGGREHTVTVEMG